MATVVLKHGEPQEPIISTPSSKNIRQAQLLAVSVEDIEGAFRRHKITAQQRNDILREKAHAVTNEMISEKGFVGAVLAKTVEGVQKGWDDIVESAKQTDQAGNLLDRVRPAGLALWGTVQTLTSVLSAVGTVSGQQAERWALGAGASPGLARLINISVDVGSGFVPVGKATQLGVKGIQNVLKVGAKEVAVGAKEAATVAKVAEDAIKKGLAVEGIGEAAGVAKATPTVAEKFLDDFNTFKRHMLSVTEPQTHAQTAALSERLGLSLDDLRNIVPGQALNEREMYAYLKALEPQVDEAIRLAKAVKVGGEAEANAFAAHMSALFTVAPVFRGAEVTAGRSVEILKETPPMKRITDMLMGWDAESVAKGDFQAAIRTMADDILVAADTPEKLIASAVQTQSLLSRFAETAWPMAREVYYNLMLARPVTHVRNFIGNSVSAGNAIVERTVGGLFSLDKQNGLVGQEGWFLLKGYAAGIADGLYDFGNAFKGVGPEDVSKLDFAPHAIPGIVGRIVNAPGDLLRGTDNLFRTILKRGSYYADALREGTHQGLTGDELANFVAKKVNAPSQAMRESGEAFATHNTYQDELGALATKIKDVAQVGPMVLWFPFMKTPINLAKYAWDRTPGLQLISGQLYKDIAAGGVKADEAMARITLATMYGQFVYHLAQEGFITGSGPVDPGLRRTWLTTHQPYSVKTKDGWMPIAGFEPGSTPIGLMADFAQIHNQLDDPSAQQLGMAAMFSVMKGLADKTYWRTLSDLVDLASGLTLGHEPGAKGRDVLLSPVTTVTTGGPLVGAITRAIDPIQRETRTLMDSYLSRIPGYSTTVPPVRDMYGESVLPPQAVGGAYLNLVTPFYEKVVTPERVRDEGDRLQIKVPPFPWVIGGTVRDDFDIRAPRPTDLLGVELTPAQRDRAQELYKTFLRDPEHGIEKELLDTEQYKGFTPAGQREAFMDLLAVYRRRAISTLSVEDPAIGAKLIESRAIKQLPLLHQNEQDELLDNMSQSVDEWYRQAPEMRENLLRWGTPPGED